MSISNLQNKLKLHFYNKIPVDIDKVYDCNMYTYCVQYYIKYTNIFHRMDGPAIVFCKDSPFEEEYYYIYGFEYTKKDYYKFIGKEHLLLL